MKPIPLFTIERITEKPIKAYHLMRPLLIFIVTALVPLHSFANNAAFAPPVGSISLVGDKYVLSDKVSCESHPEVAVNFLQNNHGPWRFWIESFAPEFETKAQTCSLKNKDGMPLCDEIAKQNVPFISVSGSVAEYHEPLSPACVDALVKKDSGVAGPGCPRVGETTTQKVATAILLAPWEIVFSPIIIYGELQRTTKTISFDHMALFDTTSKAIHGAGFKNIRDFQETATNLCQVAGQINLDSDDKWKDLTAKRQQFVKHGDDLFRTAQRPEHDRSAIAATYEPKRFEPIREMPLQGITDEQPLQLSNERTVFYANESAALRTSMDSFSSAIEEAQVKSNEILLAEATRNNEIMLAESKRKEAERLADLAASAAEQKRLEKEYQKMSAKFANDTRKLRSNIQVGSETHCGLIIEVRKPLAKIALNASLPGYSSEAWVRISDIYPPSAGCSNRNGQILPTNLPNGTVN